MRMWSSWPSQRSTEHNDSYRHRQDRKVLVLPFIPWGKKEPRSLPSIKYQRIFPKGTAMESQASPVTFGAQFRSPPPPKFRHRSNKCVEMDWRCPPYVISFLGMQYEDCSLNLFKLYTFLFYIKVVRNYSQVSFNSSVAWVRERTIPTERPPLVGEVSSNFFV
jgi:hypothetical protein